MTKKKNRLEADWLSAKVAYENVSALLRNPHEAGQALATYLRDGRLRARARSNEIVEMPFKEAFRSVAPQDVPAEIPKAHWRKDLTFARDIDRWRWPTSDLFITVKLKPKRVRVFRKVEFSSDDLSSLFPDLFAARTLPGPKPQWERTDCIWSLAVRWHLDQHSSLSKPIKEAAMDLLDELNGMNSKQLATYPLGQQTFNEEHCERVLKQATATFRGEAVFLPAMPRRS